MVRWVQMPIRIRTAFQNEEWMNPRIDRGSGPDASADPVREDNDLVVPYFGKPAFDGKLLLGGAPLVLYLAFRKERYERNVPRKNPEFSQNPRRDDFVDYFFHHDPRWGYYLKL